MIIGPFHHACRKGGFHLKVARVCTADGQHEVVGIKLPAGHERAIIKALRDQAHELAALRAAAPNAPIAPDEPAGAEAEAKQVLHGFLAAFCVSKQQ